jgi:hypothetical protein
VVSVHLSEEEQAMMMGEEIRILQPQAKECLEPPEAGRGKGRFFPTASGGSMTLAIP